MINGSASLVPTVIEQETRGERALDIYSRLLRERIVFLGTEIDDGVANLVTAQLLHLASEDAEKDIDLYINSPGGSATSLFAIYDTMRYVKPDVATTVIGQAASAAAVILAAGARGKRFALPNARVIIHQPHGGAQGQSVDIEILAEHTGQSVERIRKDTDRDYIMRADEAKAYGIVDHVISGRRPLAVAADRSVLDPSG